MEFTYSDGEKELEQIISFEIPYSRREVNVTMYLDSTIIFESDLPGDFGTLEVKHLPRPENTACGSMWMTS